MRIPDRHALNDFLACAEAAARAAGVQALSRFREHQVVLHTRKHDLKLKLDRECQALAEEVIRKEFPGHAVYGEESAGGQRSVDFMWVIDPIDGTVNYYHGLPWWCCSVAVLFGGQTVAGAVFAPALNECYTASVGNRSLCNGRLLAVSKRKKLGEAVVLTGIDRRDEKLSAAMDLFRKLSARTRKLRIMGAAALDICGVASGRADGFYEAGIYLWDVAAASLIVRQAGGRAEILRQDADGKLSFLATNAYLFPTLKRLLKK